jgi:hypothetical protein
MPDFLLLTSYFSLSSSIHLFSVAIVGSLPDEYTLLFITKLGVINIPYLANSRMSVILTTSASTFNSERAVCTSCSNFLQLAHPGPKTSIFILLLLQNQIPKYHSGYSCHYYYQTNINSCLLYPHYSGNYNHIGQAQSWAS